MTNIPDVSPVISALERIAAALERLAPPPEAKPNLKSADAFVWRAESEKLIPVQQVSRVDFALLKGIERQAQTLLQNTLHFANALPANNALLWGARGTGKSSLVKAVHAEINTSRDAPVVLVEIHREDIASLPRVLDALRDSSHRCILFCDDLSFDAADTDYKSLKAVLDGGIEGRPENVIFYATSNRRHLMAREMIENERSTAINRSEATEEKVSLSDRFGLWLGFHHLDQDTYFDICEGYAQHFDLDIQPDDLRAQALEWSVTRGSRSGRVAWQFVQALAGEMGQKI